jgi:hypothetical protein
MQDILNSASAAFTLLVILIIGWLTVLLAATLVERRLRGKHGAPGLWASFTWVWDNSNLIGIPLLLAGAAYLIWAINYGPGVGGIGMLVIMLMAAAAALIGFAPALRRR